MLDEVGTVMVAVDALVMEGMDIAVGAMKAGLTAENIAEFKRVSISNTNTSADHD